MRKPGRAAAIGALVAALTVLGPGIAPPAGATFPGTTKWLAFQSQTNGQNSTNDIWLYNLSLNSYTDLTNSPDVNDQFPTYSADGKHLAWVRDHQLWVMSPSGGNAHVVSTEYVGSPPTFTPDGHIVFPGSNGLEIIARSGLHEHSTGLTGTDPSVSPNGIWLAYSHYSKKAGAYQIFKAHLDGTHVVDLTPTNTFGAESPDWAPDGRHIIYNTSRSDGSTIIITMRPDGTHKNVLDSAASGDVLAAAKYSPDGFYVAFVDLVVSGSHYHIWVRSGFGYQDISESDTDYGPAWRPQP